MLRARPDLASSSTPSSPSAAPSAPHPDRTAPSSNTQQLPSSDSGASGSSKPTKAQTKDCISKQLANKASRSKDNAKKYCTNQLSGTPNGCPHRAGLLAA